MSVIRISKMHVRPCSQNRWQLASPLSSVVVGGAGGVAVGGDGGGGVVLPTPALARWLVHVKIQGSRSTRLGESAMPHRCHHSSATSSCRIWTRPPTLHESACSTVILAPQPLQAAGISSGEWLYLRRMLSLHLSANRPVPFNRFGNTDSPVLLPRGYPDLFLVIVFIRWKAVCMSSVHTNLGCLTPFLGAHGFTVNGASMCAWCGHISW